jgi:hypothetical protein
LRQVKPEEQPIGDNLLIVGEQLRVEIGMFADATEEKVEDIR